MDWEDLEPRAKTPPKKDLEAMSVEALQDYIADLEQEIVRARETIARKTDARSAAESFFKKP